MKKSLFLMAAASALMLTACTSEDDVLQSSAPQKTEAKALGFDVYLPQVTNVTRAGYEGVMTTEKLKINSPSAIGFGVFAYYQDGIDYSAETGAAHTSDFMFNQQVKWNGGWTYSPLKYWPNETYNDSQTPNATTPGSVDTSTDPDTYTCDKLSFFAYAPYVNFTTGGDLLSPSDAMAYVDDAASPTGIIAISKETFQGDPMVKWKYTTNPDKNVDLLWGVAPAGMSYTAVNGGTINKTFGYPLIDMVKPGKDQQMKFLFQHALSRMSLSVVSAIDQVAPGDDANLFATEGNTKILIKKVELFGDFASQGVLNLNNTTTGQNKANWVTTSLTKSSVDGDALFTFDNKEGAGTPNGYIANDLRYVTTQITAVTASASAFSSVNAGVLSREQSLLEGGLNNAVSHANPSYSYGTVYYSLSSGGVYSKATTTATAAADVFTKNAAGDYEQFAKSSAPAITLDGTTQYYTLGTPTAKTVTGTPGNPGYTTELEADQTYYSKTGTEAGGDAQYKIFKATGTEAAGTYYAITETEVSGNDYATGTYYTGTPAPRYVMVIPTGETPIKVKITYAVVTKDEKLADNVSNVENVISKETTLNLENGKSYNLKLILGLTSVKLDATVADWKVGDETEFYLPKNNE